MLGQQAVVLDKGRHFRGPLCLVVDGAVDFHVAVEDVQEALLSLPRKRGNTLGAMK